MPKTVTAYDVLISCPGDVAQFVEIIENTLNKFNNFYGREHNVVLRPISWKNNAFPEYGHHPQKILNEQIVKKADFAVAIFWIRFGTETEDFGSGTEEEIENMIADGKQIFLYFLDKSIQPSKFDQEQYRRVNDFKEKYNNKGLFFVVPDEDALARKLRENLELYIDSKLSENLELSVDSIVRGKKLSKSKKNKLVLWVDDCPENNVYVRNILENYGIRFDLALTTERALSLMQNIQYSLIISDLDRKEGPQEGYILLKQIRDSGDTIPFLIFSAEGSIKEYKEKAAKGGAQGSTNQGSEIVDMVLKQLLNL